jgi:hypothetical protein
MVDDWVEKIGHVFHSSKRNHRSSMIGLEKLAMCFIRPKEIVEC